MCAACMFETALSFLRTSHMPRHRAIGHTCIQSRTQGLFQQFRLRALAQCSNMKRLLRHQPRARTEVTRKKSQTNLVPKKIRAAALSGASLAYSVERILSKQEVAGSGPAEALVACCGLCLGVCRRSRGWEERGGEGRKTYQNNKIQVWVG